MALSDFIREKISMEVIKTLVSRFANFPEDASGNGIAPFHEAFLRAFSDKINNKVSDVPFFISLSSWLQGLNTTLGQTFFENVAQILCCGEKKEFTFGHAGVLQITVQQKTAIAEIITDLSNDKFKPDIQRETDILFQEDNTNLTNSTEFSADVFFINEDCVNAIELKSVKPNSGEMRGEKQKILHGKAALHKKYPGKPINFFIGFPFDPTVDAKSDAVDNYDKQRFVDSCINLHKYFSFDEILIARELWDFLSGQTNTMMEILEIINKIATPQFSCKYEMLQNSSKWGNNEYIEQLKDWNLFTEIKIICDKPTIEKNSNKWQLRLLYKNGFKEDGDYDWSRACDLQNLVK